MFSTFCSCNGNTTFNKFTPLEDTPHRKVNPAYHYIRYLHRQQEQQVENTTHMAIEHRKSRSADDAAGLVEKGTGGYVEARRTSVRNHRSADNIAEVNCGKSATTDDSIASNNKSKRGMPNRGNPEGCSSNKLNSMNAISKRHSIAVLPREICEKFKQRTRDWSQGRVREGVEERVMVNIDIDRHSKVATLDKEKISINLPCKKSFNKYEDTKFTREKTSSLAKTGLKDDENSEPLYERVKGSSFTSSPGASVYDNALYMTMKDIEAFGNDENLVDLYFDTDSIYSTPKFKTAIAVHELPLTTAENTYENIHYLPMTDANKPVNSQNSNIFRPLPSIPPGNTTRSCNGKHSALKQQNSTENITNTQTKYTDVNERMDLNNSNTFTYLSTEAKENQYVNSHYVQSLATDIDNFEPTCRPQLPPPKNRAHLMATQRIIKNTTKDTIQEHLLDSLFATTCKINRADIIRHSKIRQNMKIDPFNEECTEINDARIIYSDQVYSSLTNGIHNSSLSDNPDSGMSEGATTPLMSPASASASPITIIRNQRSRTSPPKFQPSSPKYRGISQRIGTTSFDSVSVSPANSSSPHTPRSDSLLGDYYSPLNFADLKIQETSRDISLDSCLESDKYVNRLSQARQRMCSYADLKFLESVLTEKERHRHRAMVDLQSNSVNLTSASGLANYTDLNLSKKVYLTVGRSLFNDVSNATSLIDGKHVLCGSIGRRNSMSNLADVSRRLLNENTVWNGSYASDSTLSFFMRKSRSVNDLSSIIDVPLTAAIDEILKDFEDRNSVNYMKCHNLDNKSNKCNFSTQSLGQVLLPVFHEVEPGGPKETVGVSGELSRPGNKTGTSQWCEESSCDHLLHKSPGNFTLKLPGMQKQPTTSSNMAADWCRNSVSAVSLSGKDVCVSRDSGQAGSELAPLYTNVLGNLNFQHNNGKLNEKQLQREEESSYRLLRLFQDSPLDCIVESEDEEIWNSGEWSMQATIDENSSRDPHILDISNILTEKLDDSSVNISSKEIGEDFVASESMLQKLKEVADDKMLAKLRKSFRKKEKVQSKLGNSMFVDNPMYLSPEVKKEAKVISSGNGCSNWYFNNPTYSSPDMPKHRVRTYTKSHSDTMQCEKENIKNLRIAINGAQNTDKSMLNGPVSTLQCNPCYDSPDIKRTSYPITYKRISKCVEAVNHNLINSLNSRHTTHSACHSKAQPDSGNHTHNGDKFLDHEYCTIPGDEESDSWITQSSGSQCLDSPSAKRNADVSHPRTPACNFKKKNFNARDSLTPSRMWREESVKCKGVVGQSCRGSKGHSQQCAGQVTSGASSPEYQNVRTPRTVKSTNRIRDQVGYIYYAY